MDALTKDRPKELSEELPGKREVCGGSKRYYQFGEEFTTEPCFKARNKIIKHE